MSLAEILGPTIREQRDGAQEVIELIMSAHYDIATCPCWICQRGRALGFHNRGFLAREHPLWQLLKFDGWTPSVQEPEKHGDPKSDKGDTTDLSAEQREALWHQPNWECPACFFTNLPVRRTCRNCGHKRPAEISAKVKKG